MEETIRLISYTDDSTCGMDASTSGEYILLQSVTGSSHITLYLEYSEFKRLIGSLIEFGSKISKEFEEYERG
jgi:hypothetical protein